MNEKMAALRRRRDYHQYYSAENGRIRMGKRRYTCDGLLLNSVILRILSLFSIALSLIGVFVIGNYSSAIWIVLAVGMIVLGHFYKGIAVEAAGDFNIPMTGWRKVLYRY